MSERYSCGCVETNGVMEYCSDHKYHKHVTAGERALAEARRERDEARADVERLRELLWSAGHAWQDQWAIDWKPICAVMDEVDAKRGEGE